MDEKAEKQTTETKLEKALIQLTQLAEGLVNGDFFFSIDDPTLQCGVQQLPLLGKAMTGVQSAMHNLQERSDELHDSSMELAMGISECFGVLEEVRKGNFTARLSKESLNSSSELMSSLAQSLNTTISELPVPDGCNRSSTGGDPGAINAHTGVVGQRSGIAHYWCGGLQSQHSDHGAPAQ